MKKSVGPSTLIGSAYFVRFRFGAFRNQNKARCSLYCDFLVSLLEMHEKTLTSPTSLGPTFFAFLPGASLNQNKARRS